MADNPLSQSEIDALLSEADGPDLGGSPSGSKPETKKGGLSAKELASALKVAEAVAGAQAAALFSAVNQQAAMEVGSAKVAPLKETLGAFDGQVLLVKTPYTQPANGTVYYLFKEEDARTIAGLCLGNDQLEAIDDNALNALQEVLKQMTGNADTEVAGSHGIELSSSDPRASLASAGKVNIPDGDYWTVQVSLTLGSSIDSGFVQLYPLPLAKALAGGKGGRSEDRGGGGGAGNLDSLLEGNAAASGPVSNIQNAEFSPLVQTADPAITGNINLLLDVPLEVTVELGRSTKTVQEVLSLGEGSIIELDKLAGEPVDLLVNGKPIAKGEVVVIDENFGVRVTEIVNIKSRLNPDE